MGLISGTKVRATLRPHTHPSPLQHPRTPPPTHAAIDDMPPRLARSSCLFCIATALCVGHCNPFRGNRLSQQTVGPAEGATPLLVTEAMWAADDVCVVDGKVRTMCRSLPRCCWRWQWWRWWVWWRQSERYEWGGRKVVKGIQKTCSVSSRQFRSLANPNPI